MNLRSEAFTLVLSPARSVDHEGWVRVCADANAGAFSGKFEAYLQLEDLQRFQREVREMHANVGTAQEAVLSCFEPGVYVRLVSERLGGIHGTYRLEPEQGETAAELSGSFRADQCYLPQLVASVQDLITALESADDV